jgi:hypothetical protein
VTGVGVASELASWPEQGAEMPASNWTLELLKLGIEVLGGALYSMLNLESILIDVAVIVEVQKQKPKSGERR